MEFISSSRGSQKLCYLGFIYTKQHERPNGTRWTCERRNDCKGAVLTHGIAGAPEVLQDHTHLPTDAKIGVAKARCRMKEIAAAGVGRTAEIYGQVQQTLTVEERQVLPKVKTWKRSICRNLS